MQSESVIILMPSYQLYCFFTCQMLDVKADGQHTRQPAFNLILRDYYPVLCMVCVFPCFETTDGTRPLEAVQASTLLV